MTIPNQYTRMGALTIIPAADIADEDSAANVVSAARLGDAGIGKKAGFLALRDNGSGDYDIVVATGSGKNDKWLLFEAGTAVTPS